MKWSCTDTARFWLKKKKRERSVGWQMMRILSHFRNLYIDYSLKLSFFTLHYRYEIKWSLTARIVPGIPLQNMHRNLISVLL